MGAMRITVFGATGFVGRLLVARLLAAGYQVRAAARHAHAGPWLLADSAEGPEPVDADVRDAGSVARAVAGAKLVINLVGAVSLPGLRAYFDLHERGARHVAEAAVAARVQRLVHISALGISDRAPSAADRSKAAGEAAVRSAFPSAVLVRPSLVYGEDDHFLARIDRMSRLAPVIPLLGAGTCVQPLHVEDFADGLVRIVDRPDRDGLVYELAGPRVYTLRQVVRLLLRARRRWRLILPLPYPVAMTVARLFDRLPGFPLNRELVALMRTDKIASGTEQGFSALGIVPGDLEEWLADRHRGR